MQTACVTKNAEVYYKEQFDKFYLPMLLEREQKIKEEQEKITRQKMIEEMKQKIKDQEEEQEKSNQSIEENLREEIQQKITQNLMDNLKDERVKNKVKEVFEKFQYFGYNNQVSPAEEVSNSQVDLQKEEKILEDNLDHLQQFVGQQVKFINDNLTFYKLTVQEEIQKTSKRFEKYKLSMEQQIQQMYDELGKYKQQIETSMDIMRARICCDEQLINQKIQQNQNLKKENMSSNETGIIKRLRDSKYITKFSKDELMLLLFLQNEDIENITNLLKRTKLNQKFINMIDTKKVYSNGLTLVEFCFLQKFHNVIAHLYNTKLKNIYKSDEFLTYCKEGNFEGVYTCLLNGVDFNQKDKKNSNETGLVYASKNGYETIVDLLMYFKVNLEPQCVYGKNALIYASIDGHTKIVEKLLKVGVQIDHQDKDGNTALMYACYYGPLEIAEKILEYGANINIKNKDQETAFIRACISSREKIIELLLIQPNLNISFKYNKKTGLQRLNNRYEVNLYRRIIQFMEKNKIAFDQNDIQIINMV